MLARATSMIVDDDGDGDARSAIARDGNGFAVEFVEREERGETTFEGVLVGCANPARATVRDPGKKNPTGFGADEDFPGRDRGTSADRGCLSPRVRSRARGRVGRRARRRVRKWSV